MLRFGKKNAKNKNVIWTHAQSEKTKIKANSLDFCFFGSSFNVVDHDKTSREINRILKLNGRVCLMYNHRILSDQNQKNIEKIIFKNIPNYKFFIGFYFEEIT